MLLKLKVGLILLFALLIRVWGLDKLPIELFGDELDAGYQAYSILKTGKDYLGHSLPINFHSFPENRSPMFIYSLVPTVAIFGLNEWGVRIAPALWGTLSILILFLIVNKLTDERTAISSSLLLAVTPWHWHYSRAGFEVSLLLLFVLLSVWFWINQNRRWWFIVVSMIFLSLSLFTYSSALSFSPFLGLLIFFVFKPNIIEIKTKTSIFLVIVASGFLLFFGGLGQPRERVGTVSLLALPGLEKEISTKRSIDENGIVGSLFHNKPTVILREITSNYLKSFSPQFLALDGDPNPTHSEIGGGFGELFHAEYLLSLVGVGILVARRKRQYSQLFLGWLLLAPLSSSVTIGGGEHATRLFLMLPPLVVSSAVGFWAIYDFFKPSYQKTLAVFIVLAAFITEIIFFGHHTIFHYRFESWRAWQYGYKEAIQALSTEPKIKVISYKGEPALIRYLFWSKTDPRWFQANFTGDKFTSDVIPGLDGFRVGPDLFFGNLNNKVALEDFLKPGMTFLTVQGRDIPGNWVLNATSNFELIKVIKDPEYSQPLMQVLKRK
ncbi:MAG: hypothetical protein UW69_C0001G0029 [Microgenomates group bacterium GW2011_GWA2_44_7]|nr:MAG: hypothetical protein UW69_C0001G0029 [Microgenomates group bacterium GW2011_GWA2_44_7]KKT78411.1 MAG: hypothetical protein UW73_C0003G0059 [Microgenomates group bacterium GW2011_GWB1_44_8]